MLGFPQRGALRSPPLTPLPRATSWAKSWAKPTRLQKAISELPIFQMEIGNQAFAGVAADGSKPHVIYSSRIATARVNPAEAALILNGKAETMKPVLGNWSRLVIFSIWQYP